MASASTPSPPKMRLLERDLHGHPVRHRHGGASCVDRSLQSRRPRASIGSFQPSIRRNPCPLFCFTGGRLNAAAAITAAIPAPTVTSLTPAAGSTSGGNTVVIEGTAFVGVSGPSAVTFGGVNATSYTVNSTHRITAVAPLMRRPVRSTWSCRRQGDLRIRAVPRMTTPISPVTSRPILTSSTRTVGPASRPRPPPEAATCEPGLPARRSPSTSAGLALTGSP